MNPRLKNFLLCWWYTASRVLMFLGIVGVLVGPLVWLGLHGHDRWVIGLIFLEATALVSLMIPEGGAK